MVLADDLQLADEASLLLLGAMVHRDEPRLFVCGTSTESLRLGGEEEAVPFDRFCSSRQKELDIRRVKLGSLSANDIAGYLRGVFAGLNMPKGFEHDLVELTQGNPLFTSEIIRKLVRDQKVYWLKFWQGMTSLCPMIRRITIFFVEAPLSTMKRKLPSVKSKMRKISKRDSFGQ